MKSITIKNLDELPKAAAGVIESLGEHTIIALHGGMGAGKTTLIREIATQLKVTDNVTSPTFAIVNQYNTELRGVMYHFDFYRIEKIEEAYDFGYNEYFDSGELCFVEWPERIEELIPEDALHITIELGKDNDERIITISKTNN